MTDATRLLNSVNRYCARWQIQGLYNNITDAKFVAVNSFLESKGAMVKQSGAKWAVLFWGLNV